MTDAEPLLLVANARDGSIAVFRLADGSLARLAVTGELPGCSTFAIDAARNLVYAGVKGAGNDSAAIVTLHLDRTTGALTRRSALDLPDGPVSYLAQARDGSVLLGASYSGGYGAAWPVSDGVLGEAVSRIEYPNLHSVLASADGRFAYFVSLGADLVAQYALDDDLRLAPLDPPTVAAPAGSGPRHLVLSARQDAVYVLTEFSGEVLSFHRDVTDGTLELRGAVAAFDPSRGLSHSRLGAVPRAEHLIWGADLHFGRGERALWCSERTGSTLAAVAVADDGSMSPPDEFVETEPQPRGFALSADGGYLVAAGERSRTVSLYAVDDDRLALLQKAETGAGANWVRFA